MQLPTEDFSDPADAGFGARAFARALGRALLGEGEGGLRRRPRRGPQRPRDPDRLTARVEAGVREVAQLLGPVRGALARRAPRLERPEPPDPRRDFVLDAVLAAAGALADPWRTALALRYGAGLAPSRVAYRFGLTVGQARALVDQGLDQLSTRLELDLGLALGADGSWADELEQAVGRRRARRRLPLPVALATAAIVGVLAVVAQRHATSVPLELAPRDGTQVVVRATVHAALALVELAIEPGEAGADDALPEMTLTLDQGLAAVDRFARGRDGALSIARELADASATASLAARVRLAGRWWSQNGHWPAQSALAGRSLELRGQGGAWTVAGGAVPERFDPELHLAFLLPRGRVKPGESWEVPAGAFASALAPGGDLAFRARASAAVAGPGEGFWAACDWFRPTLDGDVTARLTELSEDGRTARIFVTADVSDALDVTAERQALAAPGAARLALYAIDVSFRGEGELVWDLAASRARSFHLEGEVELERDVRLTHPGGARSRQVSRLAGPLAVDVALD